MTLAASLVALSVLLLACGLREIAERGAPSGATARRPVFGGRRRQLSKWISSPLPDSAARIARAGSPAGLTVAGLVSLRALGVIVGLLTGSALIGLLPGRLGLVTVALATVAGGLGPDLLLERIAKKRRQEMAAALPDALEVLAVAVGGGRSVRAGVSELARAGRGTLARELAAAAAEIECGRAPSEAMLSLRRRSPGTELRVVTLTIERSARLGSPLARELQRIAATIRDSRQRRMAEKASRAAPKIQLVIAMVLVPSVLLLIAAGLTANAGELLTGI